VLLVQNATPETIVQFHDQLSNELPSLKGKWNFNFKIFRNNPFSIEPENAHTATAAANSKFLYTLSPSYLPDSTITLINKSSTGVLTNSIREELNDSSSNIDLSIPDDHLHHGATTGLNDSFDTFVSQKLQSLWVQRQLVRGDGGQIYELENGNLTIKTSNVFLHGNFRGLLIQIDLSDSVCDVSNTSSFEGAFEKVRKKYDLLDGKLCCSVLDSNSLDKYGDLCLQYSEILNF
jgi:hypothetical protein